MNTGKHFLSENTFSYITKNNLIQNVHILFDSIIKIISKLKNAHINLLYTGLKSKANIIKFANVNIHH